MNRWCARLSPAPQGSKPKASNQSVVETAIQIQNQTVVEAEGEECGVLVR
jgi:hypothetical protein